MNWLITGGCGFLGTNLIRFLRDQGGHSIRVVDDLSVGQRQDLADASPFIAIDPDASPFAFGPADSPVELVIGDVQDVELARRVVAGADVIVHLAASTGVGPSVENPRADCQINVLGTFNYLEAARLHGASRFVFASSGAPVGAVDPPIHEDLAPHPVSPYGASKLAGEGYCSAYWGTFGVETVALRFGNVYGPGSSHKSSVVARFLKDALAGAGLEIHGDGTQTRDFIYVDDLTRAIHKSATAPGIAGEIFQIAANTETTVAELAERVLAVLEQHGIREVPVRHGEPRLGDVRRNYSDTRKARERLGWAPAYTLERGLDSTLAYFLQRHPAGEPHR